MSEELAAPATVAEPAAMPEQTAAPEVQAAPEQQPEATPEQPPAENKGKERLSMRFSELTSQREAARQDAERAKQEADYWRQQALSRQQQHQDPDYSLGNDYDPADPASLDAAVERAVEARLQRKAAEEAQNAQLTKVRTLQTTLLESGLEGAALLATGADHIPFTQAMFDALTVSEQPAIVADHLGNNPAEAARIAALPAAQQGFELARLDARLASQPRTTSAPPPPATVGARAIASGDPSSMTMEQYKAARESGRL